MRTLILVALLLNSAFTYLFSQSAEIFTKKIPVTAKGDLYFEPLVLKGLKNETILFYAKHLSANKPTTFITVVLDPKLNKIHEKEFTPPHDLLKVMGEMRAKARFSIARLQAVDFGDEYGIFYERSTDLAYFTLSKKDYSVKQNQDIELDTKVPITVFNRNRSVIKAFPYKEQLYVLFAGKEENQLTIGAIKKGGQVEYKTIKVPTIRVDKGNGKSKEVEFLGYNEFEWKNDSLFTFIYQTDNDSKFFHTIILNIEQMKARVAKYTYPSVGSNKDDEVYRGASLLNDKVLLSSINAEKTVVSIKDKSTGAEIKNFSYKNSGKIAYQNTPIVEKEAHYEATDPNPRGRKVEDANVEKFWKRYNKGGNDANIGAINIEQIDTFYRITLGYQNDKFSTMTSTHYVNMISPNQSASPGSVGTHGFSSTSSWGHKYSTEFYSYFNRSFEHIPTQKKSAFEEAIEKAETRNKGIASHCIAMKKCQIANSEYFIYYDTDTREIVFIGSKK